MPRNIRTYNKLIKPTQEQLIDAVNELIDSVNTSSASAESENYKGKPGDIKVNKVATNKYDFYVRGEDGWHRDTNSTYAPVDDKVTQEPINITIENNGQIDNQYEGTSRILLDLDSSTISGTPSPKIAITGNGTISTTGNAIIDSSGDIELNADGGDFNFKDNTASIGALSSTGLTINNISAADSDTDKFLVSDSGLVKYRTGAQLRSDIGAGTGSGDITGVSITTDSGSGSKAEDTAGSADFSILGSNGVNVTNSGTTITASAVPGEIDHDSLNNFVANEHIDWTASSAGTIHSSNYTDTNTNQLTTFTMSDGSTTQTVEHGNTLTFAAGEGIDVAVSATDTVTYSGEDASDSNKGVASFSSDNFSVSSGAVTIKDEGVSLAEMAHMATASFLGRRTSGTGDVEVLSASHTKDILGLNSDDDVAFGSLTSGAVIWQSFPFYALTLTHSRYYYVDVDDTANSLRRWDDYDTDPTGFNYRDVAGQFVVPEDCKLVAMHGVIANQSSTNNPTIGIYHGTVTEGTGDTTLALAAGSGGGAVVVSISTLRVPYKFNDTFSVNLDAGDIVVPTIYHADVGGTRTYQGNLTLKFVTR